MQKMKIHPSGVSSAKGSRPTKKRGRRGECQGWSAASARRCALFVRSIDPNDLEQYPHNYALTLTLAECPDTSDDFSRLVERFFKDLVGPDGLYHWVIEWQPRSRHGGGSVPHLHAMIFTHTVPKHTFWVAGHRCSFTGAAALAHRWMRIAQPYGSLRRHQHTEKIYDLDGWFRYVAKHSARGLHHYQRSAEIPVGWRKTGRMWGKNRGWPVHEVEGRITSRVFYALRRFCNRYARMRVEAEIAASQRRLAESRGSRQKRANADLLAQSEARAMYLKRQLVRNVEKIGRIVPLSEWIPGYLVQRWLDICCVAIEAVDHETGEVRNLYLLADEFRPESLSWRVYSGIRIPEPDV